MNENTLESFIGVCDEMMVPVQESLKTIKQKYTEALEKIKIIKEKMNEEDNITKIIALNNDCIDELDKYYKLIESDKESKLDKLKEYSGLILASFGISGLGLVASTQKYGKDISNTDIIATGASILGLIGGLLAQNRAEKKYKEGHTKYDYQYKIKDLKTDISLANVVLEEAKRLNINSYSDLTKNYTVEFVNLTPQITKK